jgi:hypothetical protein
MIKFFVAFFTLFFCVALTNAQEVVSGLLSNPEIIKEHKKSAALKSGGQFIDTVDLPFFDDFSFSSGYPDNSLWMDRDVYINSRYGKDMPTIGVATFDAIDKFGFLHDNASKKTFAADTLTSMPINFSPEYVFSYNGGNDSVFNVPIWKLFYFDTCASSYELFDSIYLKEVVQDNIISYFLGNELDFYEGSKTLYYHAQCNDTNFYVEIPDEFFYYHPDSADYVPVKREDMGRVPWNEEDSVVLSFQIQPGGYGDLPETSDIFAIELYRPIERSWVSSSNLEYSTGDVAFASSTDTFITIIIPLDDQMYLQNGFQFRFINYASLTDDNTVPGRISNADHWNLDFVYLDRGRRSDSVIIQDVAHAKPLESLLIGYEAMPASHFFESPQRLVLKAPSQTIKVRNFDKKTAPDTRYRFELWDMNGDSLVKKFPKELILDSLFAFSTDTREFNLTYNFPDSYSGDYAHFELKSILETDITQLFPTNDTISQIQRFRNYYAYDDGSAENGYGLTGAGITNAKVAVAFELEQEDELEAVQIYFNYAKDSVNLDYIKPAVWKGVKHPSTGEIHPADTASPLYVFPEAKASHKKLNLFHEFVVPDDTVVPVSGWICVGWIQSNETYLNVGLDMNKQNKNRTFYNITGTWKQSSVDGAVMVRPVFGKLLPLKKENVIQPYCDVKIYPNPACEFINFEWPLQMGDQPLNIAVFNSMGQLVFNASDKVDQIETYGWDSGMYFVRIANGQQVNITKKVIITP